MPALFEAAKRATAEEQRLVKQAKAEERAANAEERARRPSAMQLAKLYWSAASLWFAAAVAAQNRFRFLVWGEYLNNAKAWTKKAVEADEKVRLAGKVGT
jgi:hypothetical protein